MHQKYLKQCFEMIMKRMSRGLFLDCALEERIGERSHLVCLMYGSQLAAGYSEWMLAIFFWHVGVTGATEDEQ